MILFQITFLKIVMMNTIKRLLIHQNYISQEYLKASLFINSHNS